MTWPVFSATAVTSRIFGELGSFLRSFRSFASSLRRASFLVLHSGIRSLVLLLPVARFWIINFLYYFSELGNT